MKFQNNFVFNYISFSKAIKEERIDIVYYLKKMKLEIITLQNLKN